MVFLSFDSKIHVILSKMGGVKPVLQILVAWLVFIVLCEISHDGDSHALIFKALGFCRIEGSLQPRTNENGWCSVFSSASFICDKMTLRVLSVCFYRFVVLYIYL